MLIYAHVKWLSGQIRAAREPDEGGRALRRHPLVLVVYTIFALPVHRRAVRVSQVRMLFQKVHPSLEERASPNDENSSAQQATREKKK